jgi:hypothetical protein
MSFNYGTSGSHGAVGQWGAGPDIGWNNAGGAPAAATWHHLAYTYDGTTTRVYADGVELNNEVLGAGIINTHGPSKISIAAQNTDGTGGLEAGLRGTLSIARVRVHDGVLTPEQILANYNEECAVLCPPANVPECLNCPATDDELFKGKAQYVRLLQFKAFPAITAVEVTAPAGATLTTAGLLSYVLPQPAPASFNVVVKLTNDDGTSTFDWTVTLVDAPPLGGIEVAGELFVNLDANDASAGEGFWLNAGTLADFGRLGEPVVDNPGAQECPAVTFNGGVTDDAYVCFENAPAGLVGLDPTRSIEVWAYNPVIAGEEVILAWGRRGGPCGTNMSFNFGTDAYFGAVGHWCHDPGPDIGWINPADVGIKEVPTADQWHHLVYTYDGTTTRVYSDGKLANTEILGEGIINTWGDTPIALAVQHTNTTTLEWGLKGSLSLGKVRVHDGVLTLSQIRKNFDLERDCYGVGPLEDFAPAFADAPVEDSVLGNAAQYTRTLTVEGKPIPVLTVSEPAGATIVDGFTVVYTLPDPLPTSFTVTVTVTNSEGEANATWPVTVVLPAELASGPVHRYEFTADATDSVSGADGTIYGNVTFEGGKAVLNNTGNESSAASGLFPDPADPAKAPPGAYIDLPNGMISAIGPQATFEFWTTWDGVAQTQWQRIFDFGTSITGENVSDGRDAESYYLFLTPMSGANTLRFGYWSGVANAELVLDAPRMTPEVEQHIAVVWDELDATADPPTPSAKLYVNGVLFATNTPNFSLATLLDDNNWLGRSQFVDAMLDGSYTEVRIYDYPLTQSQILGNIIGGPDCLNGIDCGATGTEFYRADPNNDGSCNITDGIYVLNFLFLGGPAPTCRESSDANNDKAVNITDGIYILNYLFLGGPAPASPGPPGKGDPCGPDTDAPGSPGDLGCDTYTKC